MAKVELIAVTQQAEKVNTEELFDFAGKVAGECYSENGWVDLKKEDKEVSLKRAKGSVSRGHHSILGHANLTMEITSSKIVIMLLNSIRTSNTSEKSARRTKMTPQSEQEYNLYLKWQNKLQPIIKEIAGDTYSDSEIANFATENARYMISVFTQTKMIYTIRHRDFYYLIDWLEQLSKECKLNSSVFFWDRLSNEISTLVNAFKSVLAGCSMNDVISLNELEAVEIVEDNKNEFLRLLPYAHIGGEMHIKEEIFSDVYQTEYLASFASTAQIHRHRVNEIIANFNGDANEYGFYVPKCVEAGNVKDEWLEDISSVSEVVPQGTLVSLVERGTFLDFIGKTKERLCSRAQLETMGHTIDTMNKFIKNMDNLSDYQLQMLKEHTSCFHVNLKDEFSTCPRCLFDDFTCKERCKVGPNGAFNRLI